MLISACEMAEKLGVTIRTLNRYIEDDPSFPYYQLRVGSAKRFDPESVLAHLKNKEKEVVQDAAVMIWCCPGS